jgi:hypothetical protein
MDRYEYIVDSISMYIYGYTATGMVMNIDNISSIVYTLGGSFFIAFLIGYFLKIGLTRRGKIELEYSVLTRNSRTIQSSFNVLLMQKRG